jgi:hypothetical protein
MSQLPKINSSDPKLINDALTFIIRQQKYHQSRKEWKHALDKSLPKGAGFPFT